MPRVRYLIRPSSGTCLFLELERFVYSELPRFLTMAEDEIVEEQPQPQEMMTPPSYSSLLAEEDGEPKLKRLDFIKTATIHFAVFLSTIYEFAKDNSGPLKLGVENIEATFQTVLSPLHDMFHDVPFKLLLFLDRKVDHVFFDVETFVPSFVKQASSYEPVAEYYAVTLWRLLNRVPLFPEIARLVIPTAFYWSEKYNNAVRYVGDRDYFVAEYLPMIPIEKISDVLEQEQCRG